MLPEELDRSIQKLKAEGKLPYFVNATSGSTVLGAYDDLSALAAVCRWVSRDTCRNNPRAPGLTTCGCTWTRAGAARWCSPGGCGTSCPAATR